MFATKSHAGPVVRWAAEESDLAELYNQLSAVLSVTQWPRAEGSSDLGEQLVKDCELSGTDG